MGVDELHHMLEGREVAQVQVLLLGNAEGLADLSHGLGLLDRVDAEVGLQIEVQVEHVARVPRLLGNDGKHPLLHGISCPLCRRGSCGRSRRRRRSGRREVGPPVLHELELRVDPLVPQGRRRLLDLDLGGGQLY